MPLGGLTDVAEGQLYADVRKKSAAEHIEAIRRAWLSTPGEAAADMANALDGTCPGKSHL